MQPITLLAIEKSRLIAGEKTASLFAIGLR